MNYLIKNARVVVPEQILENHDCLIVNGLIASVGPNLKAPDATVQVFEAEGAWLAPGFIDIHADYIEHMAAPRPTSLMDFDLSLREAERELIGHGITTMYHSLSLFKTSEFGVNPLREKKNVEKFAQIIEASHHKNHLVRHRFHARFEIDYLEELESLKAYIRAKQVHLVSFMDHSPGQGQYRNLEIFKKTIQGYRPLDDQQFDDLLKHHSGKAKMTLESMRELCALATEHGIAIASHDDDSLEKVELMQSLGAKISEFPITIEVAQMAVKRGLFTVAGAPNILLGGSHSGNLSAAEAIKQGAISILCSDYYPAAILHAIFQMHWLHGQDLAAMFCLASLNPAKALGIDKQFGSIELGKKADLLLINEVEKGFCAVNDVWVEGDHVFQTRYRH